MINIYRTAVGTGRAILNDTAVQLKRAALLNKYCAAVIVGSATTDGAAVHNESAAAANVHRTAVIAGFAVHDGTAVHNELTILDLCFRHTSVGNIHCTAVAVGIRAVHDAAALQGQRTAFDFNSAVFVLPVDLATGTAVLYRQVPVFPHPDYTRIFRTTAQGMSVQIQGHGAFHIQFPSGFNIAAKLDLSTIHIIQRRRQLCFVSDGGCIGSEGRSRRHRHQRQQHTQREQDCQQLCLKRFILHSLNFLSYSFCPHSEQNALPCVISAPQFGHFVLSFVPQ